MEDWYGIVKGVKFKSDGPINDPELIYKGLSFNYWDISEAIYDMFVEDLKYQFPDDEYLVSISHDVGVESDDFENWLRNDQEMVTDYLDDIIASGYFDEDKGN